MLNTSYHCLLQELLAALLGYTGDVFVQLERGRHDAYPAIIVSEVYGTIMSALLASMLLRVLGMQCTHCNYQHGIATRTWCA